MTEKFELGRLVATPGAIEATTLRQHFNLVARHARPSRRASLRYARLEAHGTSRCQNLQSDEEMV